MTPTQPTTPPSPDYSAFDRHAQLRVRALGTVEHGGQAPGRRALAFVLDPVILALVLAVADELVETATHSTTEAAWSTVTDLATPIPLVNRTVGLAMLAMLFVLPIAVGCWEAWTGNTPAKRLLGLRVLGGDDRPASRRRLVLRWATKSSWVIVGLLVTVVPAVGVGWCVWLTFATWALSLIGCVPGLAGYDTLQDLVAGTKVVKRA